MIELLLTVALDAPPAGAWHPAAGPLLTRWTGSVNPDSPWSSYPRPQLDREEWHSLNGLWEYAIRPAVEGRPKTWDGQILVPFPLESSLSGVAKRLQPDQKLWYRRTFDCPIHDARAMLNFGAVDWSATVYVNGNEIGRHKGGYDPFSFELTGLVKDTNNELMIAVEDPCDSSTQPRGKQQTKPEGIWYTPVSGIWQTVWIESVPYKAIERLRTGCDQAAGAITVLAECSGVTGDDAAKVRVAVLEPGADERIAAAGEGAPGTPIRVTLEHPQRWTPEEPVLYRVVVALSAGDGAVTDVVQTKVAIRSYGITRDAAGRARFTLNGHPYFMIGLLDQGWWPDGLYLPPTLEAMRYDLETTRALGFNTIRKHVKVEPARWYALCDELGIIVWQDMPSGDAYIGPSDPDITRTPESKAIYERELGAMMSWLSPFACIAIWVPFNEGWGQFETGTISARIKSADSTRLVNSASGWSDRGTGDMLDIHDYAPSLAEHVPDSIDDGSEKRMWVIGEWGGLGLPIPGHLWAAKGWGYTNFKDCEALTQGYEKLAGELAQLRRAGLSGAIYTQTTDVETEVNGVMTYDRDQIKFNAARLRAANLKIAGPIPASETDGPASTWQVTTPTARDSMRAGAPAPRWRSTTSEPGADWFAARYDDSAWTESAGGFGTAQTPGTRGVIGSEWKTGAIWLRRAFDRTEHQPAPTHLVIHHDEDAVIYVDGVKIAELPGFTTRYTRVPLSEEARALLAAPGRHVLAVICHQTSGGQFIDVGFAANGGERVPPPAGNAAGVSPSAAAPK